MTKNKLQQRVDARKRDLTAEEDRSAALCEKVASFVNDIKGRSAIYALIKNLTLWKELENLIGGE